MATCARHNSVAKRTGFYPCNPWCLVWGGAIRASPPPVSGSRPDPFHMPGPSAHYWLGPPADLPPSPLYCSHTRPSLPPFRASMRLLYPKRVVPSAPLRRTSNPTSSLASSPPRAAICCSIKKSWITHRPWPVCTPLSPRWTSETVRWRAPGAGGKEGRGG